MKGVICPPSQSNVGITEHVTDRVSGVHLQTTYLLTFK